MATRLTQALARRLLIEDPASILLNRFDGKVERLDVELQRWAFTQLDGVHHAHLETLSAQKMKRLLVRASAIPFWKSWLERISFDPASISSCRDIERMPLTSRQELRGVDVAYRSNMKLSKKALGGFGGTSGSTGTPIGLYFGKKAEIRSKALLGWIAEKIKRETCAQQLSTLCILNIGAAQHVQLYEDTVFVNNRDLENTEKRLTQVYPLLLKKKPEILYAYPSVIKQLIYWLKRDNVSFDFFKAAIYFAEHLSEGERTFIKDFFRCPVYSFYGTKECSFMAVKCGDGEGFHLLKGWGYLEVISPGGTVLPLGSLGRIVYTNFENDATPFIRYDTGDTGMLFDGGACDCGMVGLKLVVEGRAADVVSLPNGTTFPVIKLHGGISRVFHDRILQLQFQEFTDKIGVNVVPVRVFSAAETKQLVSVCQELVGAPVKFEVFFHERLAALPGGKVSLILKK